MFNNDYSVVAVYGPSRLGDSERAILDTQCRLWPVVRCDEGMTAVDGAGSDNLLGEFRLNMNAPPVNDVKALSEQIPGCTFALDFGTRASWWRACLKYVAGNVIAWSVEADRRCKVLASDGDNRADDVAALQTADGEAKPAAEVLRGIAEWFYLQACSNIYGGIVEGIGLTTKERWSTDALFEAYAAIKEILPDEEKMYLCELERERRAWLTSARAGEYPEGDNSEQQHLQENTGEANQKTVGGSGGQDDDSRRRDLPAWDSLPRAVREHPWMRNPKSLGFMEEHEGAARKPAPLNRAEIQMVAEHHYDQLWNFCRFVLTGAAYGRWDVMRARYHWERVSELRELLPEENQQRFDEMHEIREKYLDMTHEFEEVSG